MEELISGDSAVSESLVITFIHGLQIPCTISAIILSMLYVYNLQSEYIQLCKTLYSLLQDSPDELELFQAMGHVANSLLGTGEENVQGDTPNPADSNSAGGDDPVMLSPTIAEGESTPPRTPPTLSSLAEGVSSTSKTVNSSNSAREDSTSMLNSDPNSGTSDAGTTDAGSTDAGTTDAGTSIPTELAANLTHVEDSFEQAMANAGELEERWFLTFEQFVGALQREPYLCQFFAEQNSIDLSGTSVDPVLNPYTRTILATSP